jgi:prepilin-type N-terminal cleavage/methylation domain-containing protein
MQGSRGYTLVELMLAVAIVAIAAAAVLNLYKTGNTIALMGENKAEAQQGARGTLQMEEEIRMAGYGYPPAIPPPPCAATGTFVSATSTAVTFWADLTNSSTILTAPVSPGNTTITVASALGFAAGNTVYLINQGQAECLTVSSVGGTTVTVPSPGAVNGYPIGSQLTRPRQITYSYAAGTVSRDPGDGTGAQPAVTGVTAFQLTYFDTTDTAIASGALAANLLNIRRIVISMTAQSASAMNRGMFTLNTSARPRNLP